MRPPKPSYSNFAADNAPDAEWWRNRLRLLQLLGGSHGAASKYDVANVLERLTPYEMELVPEMIILDGRQGRHKEALRLLTHGLGDFDTAVSYCALGGASLYGAISDVALDRPLPSREEQVELFRHLLEEFIRIEDPDDRITQTSELLTRFAGWFDVSHVCGPLQYSRRLEANTNRYCRSFPTPGPLSSLQGSSRVLCACSSPSATKAPSLEH